LNTRVVPIVALVAFYILSDEAWAFSTTRRTTTHVSSSVKRATTPQGRHQASQPASLFVLNSDNGSYDESEASYEQPEAPPPTPNAPPPVPPKRLDPLMASLTRIDPSSADVPTKNVPFFGEIPVDGSLALLIPAAGIAVIGFVLSIVIAVQSSDEIVGLLSQVSDDITSAAVSKSSQVYDDSVCRGICSSQQQDLEGLKSFMEGFKK
jgi:hypothetical protein